MVVAITAISALAAASSGTSVVGFIADPATNAIALRGRHRGTGYRSGASVITGDRTLGGLAWAWKD